jgi:NAD(P)-dependent dehydrogenase (short-subunit alcohol dehydrogenase family)
MKNIIITGASGGIGGAVTKRFLDYGWHVHLLLRSFESPAIQSLMKLPNVSVYKSDPENDEITATTIQTIKNDGFDIDFVFHSAGTFLWDDGYPKQPRSFLEVRDILFRANVKTKVSLVNAIESVYRDSLGKIEQGFIGSHAANFAPDGPERTGRYPEEAYVESMSLVQGMAKSLLASGKYKSIFLFEPGLVNTGLNEAFTEDRVESKIDWDTVATPEQYAEAIFPKEFFEARQ